MKIRSIIGGVTAGVLLSTSALAADYSAYTPSGTFDWDGFYAGLGVTGSSLTNGVTETTGYFDVIVGGNATSGDFLFGIEAWFGGYAINTGANGFTAGAEARAGYLVAPEALLYLSGGGIVYSAGAQYATIGGGAEFAVTDNMSFDVEYKYWGWSNNGYSGHSIGASALWHF